MYGLKQWLSKLAQELLSEKVRVEAPFQSHPIGWRGKGHLHNILSPPKLREDWKGIKGYALQQRDAINP